MPKPHFRPETFRLRDSIGYLVKRTQRHMQEAIEARFAAQGCTLQQWLVLMSLRDGLVSSVADLCRDLHHDSGAMTRLIDQLEARNLIERCRNPDDRRVIELRLTKTGHKVLDKLIPTACDFLNETLEGFSREEVRLLQSLLRRMLDRFDEMERTTAPDDTDEEKSS
jgi:DNA-binding MarR family transcriptional regulator